MPTKEIPRREAKKQERRSAVLAAAEELFSEKGYRNTTIQEVAEKAGLSKGGVYLYFKSKEELYLSVCLMGLAGYGERLTRAYDEAADFEERIRAVYLAYIEYALEEPALFRVLRDTFIEQVRHNLSQTTIERIERYIKGWLENGAGMVREGMERGALSPQLDPYAFSLMCWRLATSLVELALLDDLVVIDPSGMDHVFSSSIDLLIQGAKNGASSSPKGKNGGERSKGRR